MLRKTTCQSGARSKDGMLKQTVARRKRLSSLLQICCLFCHDLQAKYNRKCHIDR